MEVNITISTVVCSHAALQKSYGGTFTGTMQPEKSLPLVPGSRQEGQAIKISKDANRYFTTQL